jgi:hypothetical protein
MLPSLQDVPSTPEFVMLPAMFTWSLVRAIAKSWMERSMLTFPNELIDLPTSKNFKLKKQVQLPTALTMKLDSTMEEVELWQEKLEEAMKIIQKMKCHYPKGVQTLYEEETEEFTLASQPRKMVTRAPPIYVIPNNDDE